MANRSSVPCPDCGNYRNPLEKSCPYCGSSETVSVSKKSAGVFNLNLEEGLPTVDRALEKFEQTLHQLSGTAVALVKVIHGYGSKGMGGRIKEAFHQELIYNKHSDVIDSFFAGEDLQPGKSGHETLIKRHPHLKKLIPKDIPGNPGVTLLILKRPS